MGPRERELITTPGAERKRTITMSRMGTEAVEWLEAHVDWRRVASTVEAAADEIGDSTPDELFTAILEESVGLNDIKPTPIEMDPKKMTLEEIVALVFAAVVFTDLEEMVKEALEGLLFSVGVLLKYVDPANVGPDGPTMLDAYENETLGLIPCSEMIPREFLMKKAPIEVWQELIIPSMRNAVCGVPSFPGEETGPGRFDKMYILVRRKLRPFFEPEDEEKEVPASSPGKRKAEDLEKPNGTKVARA